MNVTFTDPHTAHVILTPPTDWTLREALDQIIDSGATDALERVDSERHWIERYVLCDDVPLLSRLESIPDDPLHLRLTLQSADDAPAAPSTAQVEWMVAEYTRRFCWDVDMDLVRTALERTEYGAALAARFLPLRPVNDADAWSTLVRIVVSNQIYPGLATKLNQTLREQYGARARFNGEWVHFYPYPDVLAEVQPDDLRPLSFSRQKADYLPAIGDAVAANPEQYDWQRLRTVSPAEVLTTLQALYGVGTWTAHYVAMRGVAHHDIFIDDKTTRQMVGVGHGKGEKINDSTFAKLTSPFAPYRSFACYYAFTAHYNLGR
jgi:DNA-3-methyladenine glycosylase II